MRGQRGQRGNRGSFRGNSSFSNSYTPTWRQNDSLPDDKDINEGLNATALKTLAVPPPVPSQVAIKDLEYIGSYNWLKDDNTPTIIVPGSPPEWRNRPTPYQVPADTGICFRDENGYRMPKSNLQPLFTAVDIVSEDEGKPVDWSTVDFVTTRNSLRNLMRWIEGVAAGKEFKFREFRIDLQLVGQKTVLFSRWEKRYREQSSGYTFGFNFEKASTQSAEGCQNATGHHRIVTYDFSGLKMVLRFEVDACLPGSPSSSGTAAGIDELTSQLANIGLSREQPKTVIEGLTVVRAGQVRPQSSMIELVTRSDKTRPGFDWDEAYPQLFLSQTGHHFLAVHTRGRFVKVEKRRLGLDDELNTVAVRLQPAFRKLRAVLEVIQKLVIENGERGRLSLVCNQDGVLKVYTRVSQESCLPDKLVERFS